MGKTYLLLLLLPFLGCQTAEKNDSWATTLPGHGTNSSPRLADLTGDGILDVVIGVGKNEWEKSDTAVIALDGANGRLLWTVAAPNQVTGTATLLDVTKDGIPDVFIGGRSAFMVGINGKTGHLLWQYELPKDTTAPLRFATHNFFNAQPVPDQSGDGIPDLLVANGGNPQSYPNTADGREPGVLMVMESTTGKVLAVAAVPDGRETYMSPLYHDFGKNGGPAIIFGTGGETIGGGLYRAAFSDLMKNDLSKAKTLAQVVGHGFIAPPALADVTQDGIPDIVTNNQGGQLLAFDGATDSILWQLKVDSTESSSSLAVGFFNDDEVPDFFGHYAIGIWPDNQGSRQLVVDGRNGKILKEYRLGCTGFFSPVTLDIDGNGKDEVLMSVNQYNCKGIHVVDCQHYLALFDFKKGVQQFSEAKKLKNLSSTPWVGDMDGDGLLDVVYSVQANTAKIIEFYGMGVVRHESKQKLPKPSRWGAYMGTAGDGFFEK
jgi:outer membrane protein assembly factor BamB